MKYLECVLCVAALASLGGCIGPFMLQADKDALAAKMLANPPPGAGRYWRECVSAFQDRQPCTEDLRIDREAASMGSQVAERRSFERAAAAPKTSSIMDVQIPSRGQATVPKGTYGDSSSSSDRQYYPSQANCLYTVAAGRLFNVGNRCNKNLDWWENSNYLSDSPTGWTNANSIDKSHAYSGEKMPPKLACFPGDVGDTLKLACYKPCASGKNCASTGVAR